MNNTLQQPYYQYILCSLSLKLFPTTIFQTWAYEDIYKAVSFLRYEAEQEDKRLREMKNKRR